MKKYMSLSIFALLFALSMFHSGNAAAACNEGHQFSGNQSWGSGWSLVCDGSSMAICCTSRPVSKT